MLYNTIIAAVEGEEHAAFFAYMGIASAIVFANLGSAYGTAKTGVGICSMGVLKPDLIFKSIIPVVMAGVLGIYGLIVSVIIGGSITSAKPQKNNMYSMYNFVQRQIVLQSTISLKRLTMTC